MFLLKIRFICMRIKHDLHINGFTLSLAWKQRLGATRKWPIVLKAILRLRSFPGSYLLVPTEQERPWEQGCHKTWTWCPVDCTMGLSVFHGEIRYHTEQVWSVTSEQPKGGFVIWLIRLVMLWELLVRELTQRRFWATHINRCEASFIWLCLINATKFVWLSVFTLIETICRKTWAKPLPKHATSPLQFDMRRSKMSFLKLPIVLYYHRTICNTEKL